MAPKLPAPEAMESKSMIKRQVDKIRRPVWSRRICYGVGLAALAALIAFVVFQSKLPHLLHQNSSDLKVASYCSL